MHIATTNAAIMPNVYAELCESRFFARNALLRAGKLPFMAVSSAKWVEDEKKWSGMFILLLKITLD